MALCDFVLENRQRFLKIRPAGDPLFLFFKLRIQTKNCIADLFFSSGGSRFCFLEGTPFKEFCD